MVVPTKNWAGNQRCVPAHVHRPRDTDEVATVVAEAAAAGERVKVIGGGHSFTDAAMTDGHLGFGQAWLSGKVKVEAGVRDLLKLRSML